jgi:5'-AMP-activated protein kinase catalytic alpha subunit
LISELPESVKAYIFGTEAPDKVHSTAIPGFTVGRVIGEGGFCQVRVGAHHLSSQKVAIKVVDKGKIQDADEEKMIRREIRTMKHLNGHSCLIRLYLTLENDQFIYIVMELATGGTLLDYIKKQKSLQKSEAARLLAQLVSGLDYCHRRGVVHRDIKLENVR